MLTLSQEGVEPLLGKINQILRAVDVTEILDEAQALLLHRNRARFLAEEDPDGNKWLPSRAGLRRRATGGTGTLFASGALFHSIQASLEHGTNDRQIATDVPYAFKHQYGVAGMYPRPFLGVSDEDLFLVEARIIQRISEAGL